MIVCCGEALVDLVPEPVPGGGPMNAAVAVARLGLPAAFVGAVSTDAYGEQIMDHLDRNGVDVSACVRSTAPTARAIVEHTPKLSFRFEGTGTADTLLEVADLTPLGAGPHLLHGGTLGLFRGRTATTLADLVERHRGLVSLDPNVRPQIIDDRPGWDHYHDRWLRHAGLYKASDEDLAWIWPGRAVESCVEELLAGAVRAVVLTKGADGIEIHTPAGAVTAPAPTVDIVDTVGAGDTIAGALLVGLVERGVSTPEQLASVDLDEWAKLAVNATTAAAITCSRPGADPPWRNEVDW